MRPFEPSGPPLRRAAALIALAATMAGCGGSPATRVDEGRAVATAFLDEVRAGHVEPAWRSTSAEFKSLMGGDSFREFVQAHPALAGPAEYVEGRPVDTGRGAGAESTFRATTPATVKAPARGGRKPKPVEVVKVMTIREDGAWKVERITAE